MTSVKFVENAESAVLAAAKDMLRRGLVERTAQIVWGAKALGGPVPIPEEVNRNFAGVYGYLRANPL